MNMVLILALFETEKSRFNDILWIFLIKRNSRSE